MCMIYLTDRQKKYIPGALLVHTAYLPMLSDSSILDSCRRIPGWTAGCIGCLVPTWNPSYKHLTGRKTINKMHVLLKHCGYSRRSYYLQVLAGQDNSNVLQQQQHYHWTNLWLHSPQERQVFVWTEYYPFCSAAENENTTTHNQILCLCLLFKYINIQLNCRVRQYGPKWYPDFFFFWKL